MPSAPHPELTPEQKQHISDRTSGMMQPGAPLRRMYPNRPGGSVAERVLMFEKSPSAFGVEPVQVRVPQRREPQLSGTVITPWKSSLHDQANKLQVIYKCWKNKWSFAKYAEHKTGFIGSTISICTCIIEWIVADDDDNFINWKLISHLICGHWY